MLFLSSGNLDVSDTGFVEELYRESVAAKCHEGDPRRRFPRHRR
jgi:hypothetical protein